LLEAGLFLMAAARLQTHGCGKEEQDDGFEARQINEDAALKSCD
jgi:hypothetical protein